MMGKLTKLAEELKSLVGEANGITSTPRKPKPKIKLRREPESFSNSGYAWRAYRDDDTPLYIGGESESEARARVLAMFPDAVIRVTKGASKPPRECPCDCHDTDYMAAAPESPCRECGCEHE